MSNDIICFGKTKLDNFGNICQSLEVKPGVFLMNETSDVSLKDTAKVYENTVLGKTTEVDTEDTTRKGFPESVFFPLLAKVSNNDNTSELNKMQKSFNGDTISITDKVCDCVCGNNHGDSDNNDKSCHFSFCKSNVKSNGGKGVSLPSETKSILVSSVFPHSAVRCDCGNGVTSCKRHSKHLLRPFSQPSLQSLECESCTPESVFQTPVGYLSSIISTQPLLAYSLDCCNNTDCFLTECVTNGAILKEKSFPTPPSGSALIQRSEVKKRFVRDDEKRKATLQRGRGQQTAECCGPFFTCEETPWSAVLSVDSFGHVVDVDADRFAGNLSTEGTNVAKKELDDPYVISCRESTQSHLQYFESKDSSTKGEVFFPRSRKLSAKSYSQCSQCSFEHQPFRKYRMLGEKRETNNEVFLFNSSGENHSNLCLPNDGDIKNIDGQATKRQSLGYKEVSVLHAENLCQLENGINCCDTSVFSATCSSQLHQETNSPEAGSLTCLGGINSELRDSYVSVGFNNVNMHENVKKSNVPYEQWLNVPILLYLVFNLIELHEAQESDKTRGDDFLFDAAVSQRLKSSSNGFFVSSNVSPSHICRRLSRTFLELKGVLLKPYFMRWSDKALRKNILSVINAWENGGPSSKEFGEASFLLLGEVSVDREAQLKQTLLYRLWKFVGARKQAQRVCIFIIFLLFFAIVCTQWICFFSNNFEPTYFIVGEILFFIVLLFSGLSLLLLHHNAVAEEIWEYNRLQMFDHIWEVIDCFRREDNNININTKSNFTKNGSMSCCNLNDNDDQNLHPCYKKCVNNPFEASSSINYPSVDSTTANLCLKDNVNFLRGAQALAVSSYELKAESKHNLSVECARSVKDDGNYFCKENICSEKRSEGNPFLSGEVKSNEDNTLLMQGCKMELGNNCQHIDGAPCGKKVMDMDNMGNDNDSYNIYFMEPVVSEQENSFDEPTKGVLLHKCVAFGCNDCHHFDSLQPSLLLEDLNTQDGYIHMTANNSCSCFTNNDGQQYTTLDTMAGSHNTTCNIGDRSWQRMYLIPTSDTSFFDPLSNSLSNDKLDSCTITALVYICSTSAIEGSFSELWNHNFLVLQRNTLDALDVVFHSAFEQFKVFLLHTPDLDAEQLKLALSWLSDGSRTVFFFSSSPDSMSSEIPYTHRIEFPFTTRGIEAIILACLGISKKICPMDLINSPKQFKLPRYKLGRRLGGGTFGNVFEAEMEIIGMRCAVKRIYLRENRDAGTDGIDKQLKEIASEVEIMNSITHPNIVRYFFCGRDDNCVSIFMELCSGGSLSEVIARGELRFADKIKRVLHDIIDAVVYLHGRGIVHRDLKPENVLFRDGLSKVSDFGAAVFKRDKLTNVKGTFAYMAPEVLLGEMYGNACDVWSIGCIAAQVLSVSLSQHDLGVVEICEMYRKMSLDETLDFDCDEPTVRSFLQLCLQRDPNKRCSAEELLGHTMLKDDDVSVHQWLLICAGRRRAQQSSRNGRSYDGNHSSSVAELGSLPSLTAPSLCSTDLCFTQTKRQQTSVGLVTQ